MPGTGERLVDLVDEKIGEIARSPMSFPTDRQDPIARRAQLAHGRRKPGYWKKRLRLVPDR